MRKKSDQDKRRWGELFFESSLGEMTKEDLLTLVQNLDTYQIELELKNEQLKLTTLELEASKQRYTSLYEFAPVAYLTLNEKGSVVDANLCATDLLGTARGQLVGEMFSCFVVSSDQDLFYLNRKRLLQSGKRQTYEMRVLGRESTPVNVLAATDTDFNNGQFSNQIRLMLIDITKQKEIEQASFAIKERYRAIVMDQDELICRIDPDGMVTFVNDSFCSYFSVDFRDILGTAYLPNIHEGDQAKIRNFIQNLNGVDLKQNIECRVETDGQLHWLQWSGRALFDVEGEKVEYQLVGRDITQRKKIEKELQEQGEIGQLFMDALPCVAVLLTYGSRKIVASNKAAVAVGAFPGKTCYESWLKLKEPCPWCLAPRLWESGEAQNGQFSAHDVCWDAYWIPVGKDLYLHYVFDNTEQQKSREALQKARDELEKRVKERTLELEASHKQLLHSEKLAAIGRLSASIAHEFNNPLQGIMTVIKGIQRHVPLEEDEQQLVSLALDECSRMKGLVENLRDFYKPSNLLPVSVDLHKLLDSLLQFHENELRTRKIQVIKNYGSNIPTITAVGDQLRQVFLNLISNAADACGNGGVIEIFSENVDEKVVVGIEDNGIGIESSDLPNIFEPFFTVKKGLAGTGLGLSVSYGIIKTHGGHIEVQSEPGVGSTFLVSLPI